MRILQNMPKAKQMSQIKANNLNCSCYCLPYSLRAATSDKKTCGPLTDATTILIRTNLSAISAEPRIIELDNLSQRPEVSIDMTQALFEAIQKRNVLALPLYTVPNLPAKAFLSRATRTTRLEQLAMLRKNLKTDAALIGEVTAISSVPQACHRPSA